MNTVLELEHADPRPADSPTSRPAGRTDSKRDHEPARRRPPFRPYHPLLLASFPVLGVFANNLGAVPVREPAIGLAVAWLLTLAFWSIVGLLFRCRMRAALATSWTLVCMLMFSQGAVGSLLTSSPRATWYLVVGTWAIATTAGIVWLGSRGRDVGKLTRLTTMFAVALTCGPLFLIGSALVTGANLFPETASTARELPEARLVAPAPRRDVYYLVFDRYADAETLRHEFEFDNEPFLAELRRRGFRVARRSRANYCRTDVSMSSALNMQYHDDVMRYKQYYAGQLRDHAVGRHFKRLGYEYHHYGNLLDGIRDNPRADLNYRFSSMPTEFGESVLRTLALGNLLSPKGAGEQELEKFELLARRASSPRPKFVYAHFLLPHDPWKFDRDGSPPEAGRSDVENYVRQLQFTNTMILRTIDAIRDRSAIDPVIVLQADEGPELKYDDDMSMPLERKMRKRLGILTALLLPDRDAAAIVSDDISPVNTFRLVFREYFSAELPLLENRCYYWDPDPANVYGKPENRQLRRRPYRLVDVTEQLDRFDRSERNEGLASGPR